MQHIRFAKAENIRNRQMHIIIYKIQIIYIRCRDLQYTYIKKHKNYPWALCACTPVW